MENEYKLQVMRRRSYNLYVAGERLVDIMVLQKNIKTKSLRLLFSEQQEKKKINLAGVAKRTIINLVDTYDLYVVDKKIGVENWVVRVKKKYRRKKRNLVIEKITNAFRFEKLGV